MSFLAEIKRRKIFQVAAVYLVVAWLIVQIIVAIEAPLHLPDWVDTLVIVLLAVGLPITLIVSWGFNLTPEGIVREGAEVRDGGAALKIEYILLGAVLVALVWLVYRVEFDEDSGTGTSIVGLLPNSIAVLPCDNLSHDPDDAFFASGIHESTLNQLAKIRDLIVIARTSVLQYSDDPPPIPDIASALKVETIMECSVRYADGRVLIAAQLIDGQTGGHLWSDEYNRELTEIFAVQAEVARRIASELQAKLLPDEQARIDSRPTDSEEAYRHYLHALSLTTSAHSYPNIRVARIESLRSAIAADSGFAEAHYELASDFWFSRDQDRAFEYAEKSIELDPNLGSAYSRLAYYKRSYFSGREEARKLLERAVEFSPNDPAVLTGYARYLVDVLGRHEQAIPYARRSVAVDPSNGGAHYWLSDMLARAGELPAAVKHGIEATRLEPNDPSHFWVLACAEYLSGDRDAAKQSLDHAVRISTPEYTLRLGYMAYLYGLLGEMQQAEVLTTRLKDAVADPERENYRYLRWATLGTRNKNRAIEEWTLVVEGYLEKGERVSPGTIGRFRENWLKDPMLDQPEFLQLRRRLGYEG